MDLSVCIITKNECDKLERCLSHLKKTGFELVVVDTGSTDGTVSMARKYTDSIYEFEWVNDFAVAKNYAVSKAKHDMILAVDSDEYLITADMSDFVNKVSKYRDYVGRVWREENFATNEGMKEKSVVGTERVFDRRKYHFAGRIHEQIVRGSIFDHDRDDTRAAIDANNQPIEVYDTGLLFDHDGYDGSESDRKAKASRNLALLLEEAELRPNDPYILFQIAKSVYLTSGVESAIEYYEKALGYDVNPELDWVRDMVVCYGYALLENESYEQAMNLSAVYDEFHDCADYVFLMGLIYMNNAMFDAALEEFKKCTSMRDDRAVGVTSYKAYYNAAVIYECLGDIATARQYYALAGDYGPAKERAALLINREINP